MKFNSMADLRADVTVLNPNDLVQLLGYYFPGDGGGGDFYWDKDSTAADNGGTVIKRTAIADGRFRAILQDVINVKCFGARGNNTDDTQAIAQAVAASIAMNTPVVYLPEGAYVTTQDITLTANHQTIRGEDRYLSGIILKNGAKVVISGTQYAQLTRVSIRTAEGEKLSPNGLLLVNAPLTLVEDVYVTGYYLECGIRMGIACYSTRFVRCITNHLYTGDGWWFREADTNSVQLLSCCALNTSNGCGISVSQANNLVLEAPQLEANKQGHIQFYASAATHGLIRSMIVNDLYSEQSNAPAQPTFTVKHEGGEMLIRGLQINGGYVNGFNLPYFADFSGVISGHGSIGISCNNVNIYNVQTAGYNFDRSVRGYINGPAPIDAITMNDSVALAVTLPGNDSYVSVVRKRSVGIADSMQPVLLGPFNATLTQAGGVWYDSAQDNLRFRDAKGDYTLGARRLYVLPVTANDPDLSKIKQDYFIPVNATAATVRITLPAASAVPAGLEITIKKIDGSANVVTIVAGSPMDGVSSRTLNVQYEALTVVSDGSSLYRIVSMLKLS